MTVSQEPPEPIDEIPPDVKPKGDDVRWTSGAWLPADQSRVSYQPAPPESLEQGTTSPQPSRDHYWVPGCWLRRDGEYRWRTGSWARGRAGWVWVPDHYVLTGRGAILVRGYWDHPLAGRGLLYAPLRIQASARLGVRAPTAARCDRSGRRRRGRSAVALNARRISSPSSLSRCPHGLTTCCRKATTIRQGGRAWTDSWGVIRLLASALQCPSFSRHADRACVSRVFIFREQASGNGTREIENATSWHHRLVRACGNVPERVPRCPGTGAHTLGPPQTTRRTRRNLLES
jgi:hypothetical protein